MTKTAFLRVYSPIGPSGPEPVPGFLRSYGMLSESEEDFERVVEWQGKKVSCPSYLRLRVLESTVAFANSFQSLGVGLIPEAAAEAADRELRTYRAEHPDRRSHVLTSAWHVPVRWFVGFVPGEREVYGASDAPRIRYRADIVDVRSRLARAIEVLRQVGMIQGPAAEMEQLVAWLAPFSDDSMVELDFAEVSDLFDPEDIVLEDSVALIQDSVEALATGDMMRAGELYGTVVTRWSHAYAVTFSS
ncbi:MAG: hypothetical protein DWQ40_03630 [Actinobacteria bacterium]|nr:MAG: hypothetical protein DWQ40_03630 [Actinomycetota bacterium]REK38772.1 MAG: hypothetical protein DWQ20_03310 [Actinomycetota bacterium]